MAVLVFVVGMHGAANANGLLTSDGSATADGPNLRHTGSMRSAVRLLALAVAALCLGVGVARAAGTTTTTSTSATQTDTTSSTTTDTTTTETTTTDTTATDTTTTTTTTGTTTTTTSTTGTTPAPSYAPLASSSLPAACVGAGVLAVVRPSHRIVAFGGRASTLGPSAYGTVLRFASSVAHGSTCVSATVRLRSVSLFRGAVTARMVRATNGAGSVLGLEIDGIPVSIKKGQAVQVGRWGILFLGRTVGRVRAPLVLRLVRAHDSLPAGTELAVGFAAAAATPPAQAHTGKGSGHARSPHPHASPAFPSSASPFVLTPAERRNPVVSGAIKYLGVPYLWGGASPKDGFDCSGLVKYVFARLGVDLPHFAASQFYSPDAVPVPADKLKAGDLVFFVGSDGTRKMPGHVGIYIGDGYLIDAPHTGAFVEIDSLRKRWFANNYVGARRILSGSPFIDARQPVGKVPRHVLAAGTDAPSALALTWIGPSALVEQAADLPSTRAARTSTAGPVLWASASLGGVLLPSVAVAVTYRRRRRKPVDAAGDASN